MKKCTSFEKQKSTRYIRENVYFAIIIFKCISLAKLFLRFLLSCFVREIKDFYQDFLENEVDFRDIMNVSPNILKLKFENNEVRFFRWKSTDNNGINIFLSLENPWTFLLAKEKTRKQIFNSNSELSQNRTGKQIMSFKTTVNYVSEIYWYMMLFSHRLFWLKNWRFSTNSCKKFIVSWK